MKKQDPLINDIVKSIQDKKGKNIVIADLQNIESASTQYFVICEGNSNTQVSAIADNVWESVRESLNIKPFAYEGYQNSEWIVIDYGHIYVHVFQREQRNFYKLEKLWNDAKLTVIPNVE